MKTVFKTLAIIALAALIGFSMAACDDGSGGPDGSGGGGTGGTGGGGGGRGTLTITGLPRGEWHVSVWSAGTDLSTFDAIEAAMYDSFSTLEAARRQANNNVFILTPNVVGQNSYTGSGRKEVLLTDNDADYYNTYYYATGNFSNGSATVAFSSFRRTTMPSY